MNIKEFYSEINGNYDDVYSRLQNDVLMTKIVKMFLNDNSYNDLKTGLETGDGELAFRGAHTLKGVCLNLGFSNMTDDVVSFTEDLRPRSIPSDYNVKFDKITSEYNKVLEAIRKLD